VTCVAETHGPSASFDHPCRLGKSASVVSENRIVLFRPVDTVRADGEFEAERERGLRLEPALRRAGPATPRRRRIWRAQAKRRRAVSATVEGWDGVVGSHLKGAAARARFRHITAIIGQRCAVMTGTDAGRTCHSMATSAFRR
jgi:hypothetical protein